MPGRLLFCRFTGFDVVYFAHLTIDAPRRCQVYCNQEMWYISHIALWSKGGLGVKTVYVGMVSDIVVALYLTLILVLKGFLQLDTTWLRYLYLLFTIALIVVVVKNHQAIKRNEDEMVKALMGKIDSMLLRSWEFFIVGICVAFAIIPAMRGKLAPVYFLTFICLWQLIVFVARLVMFWYYDRVK